MVIFELSQIEIRPISANEANCCNDSNSYICMYVYVYIPIHPPLSLCLSREISIRGWFANFQCFDRKYRLNVISVPFNGTTKIELNFRKLSIEREFYFEKFIRILPFFNICPILINSIFHPRISLPSKQKSTSKRLYSQMLSTLFLSLLSQ